MESSTSADNSKKGSLEELSKEELVKKCKGLLTIAQKAKQTKLALLEENEELKSKLSNQKQYQVSQELIENLTQQKLDLVTQIETLTNKYNAVVNTLKQVNDKLALTEQKASKLDSENVSYKRQVTRLTDENEQLITHLDSLEKQAEEFKKISMQQQQQLLELEKSNTNGLEENGVDVNSQITELQKMLAVSLEEVKKLKAEDAKAIKTIENLKTSLKEKDENLALTNEEIKGKNIVINQLREEIKQFKNESSELTRILAEEKQKSQKLESIIDSLKSETSNNSVELEVMKKLKEKLKLYHSKIVKFAGSVKVLKEDRNMILSQFKTYTEQVKEWKTQLTLASEQLLDHVNRLQLMQNELINEKEKLIEMNNKMQQQLEAHKTDDEKTKEREKVENLQQRNESLLTEINNLRTEHERIVEELNKKVEETNNEKARLMEEIENLNDINKNASDQIDSCYTLYEKEKQEFIIKLEETQTENSNLLKEMENMKSENIRLCKKFDNLMLVNHKMLSDINEKNATIKKLEEAENERLELKQLIDEYEKEQKDFQSKISSDEKKLQEYEVQLTELNKSHSSEVRELKDKVEELQKELEHEKETDRQLAERSKEEILNLVTENKKLSELNSELSEELQELRRKKPKMYNSDTQTDDDLLPVSEFEEQISCLKRENTELLTEMNEMNQALKERGETISQLEAHCEEIMKKVKMYETQANKNIDNITEKEEIIKTLENEINLLRMKQIQQISLDTANISSEKDKIIASLQSEIEALKEKLNCNLETSYAESENMSSSTVSKAEEMNRLKELEGSWEERYGKLRNLALKLKAKIKQLTAEVTKQQSEKEEIQQKLGNSLKTIQVLQSQNDKLEEDLETSRKQEKEYLSKLDAITFDMSKEKARVISDDEIIVKLKQEITELKNEKATTETWKKQVSGKVQLLRKELESNNLMRKEFETNIAKLQADLDEKDRLLKAEIESHKQTKNSLEQSNNECKKNSVLSLEMQDYEKTVKDLSQKLEKKQEMVTKLKNQVDSQKGTMNALREQYKLLEEQTVTMEKDLAVATSETASYKRKISELEELIVQKEDKIQSVTQLLESARSENEELSTELSKVIADHQKINGALKAEKEQLRNQNLGLQQQLRDIQHNLQLKEKEVTTLQTDYESYKVRAQSVLRQNQNRDIGLEEKLNEELVTLKSKCDLLTLQLNESKEQLESLKQANEKLAQEKNELDQKCRTLSEELVSIKNQYDQLNTKHQQTITDHAETVRNLKIHSETLSQCYRQQLSELEARHNKEIIELQSKLDKAPSPSELIANIIPSMPREEGEGSESVESNNSTTLHPVPLERLLGTDSDQELAPMKKQISEQESKIAHLTALLSDTEQDLAKHVQMNKLLKEEIRRQQRSVEREKHAENLEYLKNVVFKFVTLNSGDERTRLVPVLNTILKLSPEETQKLNMVAKGDPGIKGWTNYLPMWSSPSK